MWIGSGYSPEQDKNKVETTGLIVLLASWLRYKKVTRWEYIKYRIRKVWYSLRDPQYYKHYLTDREQYIDKLSCNHDSYIARLNRKYGGCPDCGSPVIPGKLVRTEHGFKAVEE